MRYPAECPVFEVTRSDHYLLPVGMRVECYLADDCPWDPAIRAVLCRWVGTTSVDVRLNAVKPLTKAARDMLAIAMGK